MWNPVPILSPGLQTSSKMDDSVADVFMNPMFTKPSQVKVERAPWEEPEPEVAPMAKEQLIEQADLVLLGDVPDPVRFFF